MPDTLSRHATPGSLPNTANLTASFHVIVVGGGSAGCVLASRLSEDPSCSVLLLEAGRAYAPDSYPEALKDINGYTVAPDYIWGYQGAAGLPPHDIAAFAGRLLGGSSAINGAISRRARPSDFARWQRHGLPGWSFEEALAAYKTMENTSVGEDRWHGRSGPWPIHQPEIPKMNATVRAFMDAAAADGFTRIDDFNGEHQHGVGLEPRNMIDGTRFNAGMMYLPAEVRGRQNLTIRGDVAVDRIVFEGTRAAAVVFVGGESWRAAEIVLCAGVFGTPAILLRSGVGPRDDLSGLGIPLVADLPVGRRLQEQPMFALSFQLKKEAGTDPVTGSVALWTRSAQAAGDELDLQLTVFVQPAVDPAGAPIMTLHVWASVVLPESTGTVKLKSRDPREKPLIDYRLLSVAADRPRLREVMKLARRVVNTEPFARLIETELAPGPTVVSDADLDAAIDAAVGIYYHATSTAPMGTDAAAVADGEGRVLGLQGLRVADASCFPEMVSPPVHLTVLMVAERIAALMHSSETAKE